MKLWKIGLILGIFWGLGGFLLTIIGYGCADAENPSECRGVPDVFYTLFWIPLFTTLFFLYASNLLAFATGYDILFLLSYLSLLLTPIVCGIIGASIAFTIEKIKIKLQSENKSKT